LVVTISQSGETADTLAALKHARSLGMQHTLTICNVSTSAMVRECSLAYVTRAGVEIGVASTKAFTTQLAGLFLLTLAPLALMATLAALLIRGGSPSPTLLVQ
jgi:glucosamine--fructose-6-phosphate aminotransferase (isomerizing)